MAGPSGKLVDQISIKSDGDVFHELFREKPHQISGICPDKIQTCDLHEGEWGKVGSIIVWNYFHGTQKKILAETLVKPIFLRFTNIYSL